MLHYFHFSDHLHSIYTYNFKQASHAKTIWRVVYVATGLTPPKSMTHMLWNWLTGISMKERRLIFVGAAALIWAIWCTRNDLIFEKKIFTLFMRAVFRGAYWLQFWSLLQREDTRKTICLASKALEVVALDIFVNNE